MVTFYKKMFFNVIPKGEQYSAAIGGFGEIKRIYQEEFIRGENENE